MSTEHIDGYVLLSSYDDRTSKSQEHSSDYKRIREGIEDGTVHGLQDGKSKRWLVNKKQADALLAEHAEARLSPRKAKASATLPGGIDTRHAESVCESLGSIDTTLDEIYRVLERLTAAVESIATQPKTAQQEVLATMSSNGFHN